MVGLVPTPLVKGRMEDDDLWKRRGWFLAWKDLAKHHAKTVEKYGQGTVGPGDIVSMWLDPTEGTLAFAVNDTPLGIAFRGLAPDVPLLPVALLPDKGDAVELCSSVTYSASSLGLGLDSSLVERKATPQKRDQSQKQQHHQQTASSSSSSFSSPNAANSGSSGSGIIRPRNGCFKHNKECMTIAKPSGSEPFVFDSDTPIPQRHKTRWAVYLKVADAVKVQVGVRRVGTGEGGGVYLDCASSSVVGLPGGAKQSYKVRIKSGYLVSAEADTASGTLTFYVNYEPLLPPVFFMTPQELKAGTTFVESTVLLKSGDVVEVYF